MTDSEYGEKVVLTAEDVLVVARKVWERGLMPVLPYLTRAQADHLGLHPSQYVEIAPTI